MIRQTMSRPPTPRARTRAAAPSRRFTSGTRPRALDAGGAGVGSAPLLAVEEQERDVGERAPDDAEQDEAPEGRVGALRAEGVVRVGGQGVVELAHAVDDGGLGRVAHARPLVRLDLNLERGQVVCDGVVDGLPVERVELHEEQKLHGVAGEGGLLDPEHLLRDLRRRGEGAREHAEDQRREPTRHLPVARHGHRDEVAQALGGELQGEERGVPAAEGAQGDDDGVEGGEEGVGVEHRERQARELLAQHVSEDARPHAELAEVDLALGAKVVEGGLHPGDGDGEHAQRVGLREGGREGAHVILELDVLQLGEGLTDLLGDHHRPRVVPRGLGAHVRVEGAQQQRRHEERRVVARDGGQVAAQLREGALGEEPELEEEACDGALGVLRLDAVHHVGARALGPLAQAPAELAQLHRTATRPSREGSCAAEEHGVGRVDDIGDLLAHGHVHRLEVPRGVVPDDLLIVVVGGHRRLAKPVDGRGARRGACRLHGAEGCKAGSRAFGGLGVLRRPRRLLHRAAHHVHHPVRRVLLLGEGVPLALEVRCHARHGTHILRDAPRAQEDEVVEAGEHRPTRLVDDGGDGDAVLGEGLE
mmetsp:Transcript_4684/g.13773  ORF Transcript_4684/g.13773 Transcript_4684/m.13773 type:complete len:590 (+) Transcript_4684:253-2022(+)